MRVLGIDPGTNLMGMAVVEESAGNLKLVCAGLLDLRNEDKKRKDKLIYKAVASVINEYHPDCVAVEDQFIGINPRSGMKVASAKNMAILAAQMANIDHYEYSPSAVKYSACGCGSADKEYVSIVVRSILGLRDKPKYYDVTDAMAVAICHMNKYRAYEMAKQLQKKTGAVVEITHC